MTITDTFLAVFPSCCCGFSPNLLPLRTSTTSFTKWSPSSFGTPETWSRIVCLASLSQNPFVETTTWCSSLGNSSDAIATPFTPLTVTRTGETSTSSNHRKECASGLSPYASIMFRKITAYFCNSI